jgi:hypothetical protein
MQIAFPFLFGTSGSVKNHPGSRKRSNSKHIDACIHDFFTIERNWCKYFQGI